MQRYDLPNGDILPPIYYKEVVAKQYFVTVLRCSFDGVKLKYVEHGNEMTVPVERGLVEPSIAHLKGQYY